MPPKKGGKKGASGYKMAPKLPNGTVLQVILFLAASAFFYLLTSVSSGFRSMYFESMQNVWSRTV